MPFPEAERVIYQRSPLREVICQLKFPPILRIEKEVPAEFQEVIRSSFPLYRQRPERVLEQLAVGGPQSVGGSADRLLVPVSVTNHEFVTADEEWKVNLTRTFLALSTLSYKRWEAFRDKLQLVASALIEVYRPQYFSRVGLRYVNIVSREALGLRDVPWSELIQPYVLGIASTDKIGEKVKSSQARCEVELADGGSLVRIVTGFVQPVDTDEVCYIIDNDFFNEGKTDCDEVWGRLSFFNDRARRLLRWTITDRLHRALRPIPLG